MKKKTYLAVISALGFSVFSGKLQAQNQPQSWDARITSLKGSVSFYPAKSPQQGYAAVPGLPLESGDRIVTNADGQAQIAFNGSGVISLTPNSSLTVKALSQAKTSLFLGLGNIIAKFEHLLSAQNLQVQTPMAVAAIRGTEFGVGVSPKNVSKIGVFDEGKVEVTNHAGHQFLKPHQELSVKSKNEKLPHPRPLQYFLKYRKQMADVRKSLASVHLKWKQKHKDVFRQSGPNRHAVRKSFMRQMRKLGRQGQNQNSGQ